ncbi:MAG: class I SAM-dependent methyltransferase [Rhodobacteraceae bacterium]|nr:class I SAM-dependent methyltransferase [Paracoccaceae bacterium]
MIEDRDWPAAELARLHAAVPATYQAKAAAWDARRSRSFREQPWIDRTVAGLRRRESVLDLGCGAGRPIAGYLIGRGFRVTGLDIAPAMLDIARSRYPDAAWVEGDMRVAPLPAGLGAIIGWDSAFHLSGAEQAVLIPRLVAHLRPGGRLFLTVGPAAGEAVGEVDGAALYHASLDPHAYTRLCREAGCAEAKVTVEDRAADRRTVLLARRSGAAVRPIAGAAC